MKFTTSNAAIGGALCGLGVEYNSDWAGRYYVTESDFLALFAKGFVAYRVNDWLSLGPCT